MDGEPAIPEPTPQEPEPPRNQRNYRITNPDKVGVGSPKQKCRHNLAAIELLKQLETEDKRTASFVSVSRQTELKIEIRQAGKWEPVQVNRLGMARADIRQARGYLPVRCNGQPLSAISVTATGNFVAVLYDDENGTLRSRNFQDYKNSGKR